MKKRVRGMKRAMALAVDIGSIDLFRVHQIAVSVFSSASWQGVVAYFKMMIVVTCL